MSVILMFTVVKLGKNFRGKAQANRVMGEYIKIKQGRNVVILTENQVKKMVEALTQMAMVL